MAELAIAYAGSLIGGAAITGTVMGLSGAAFGWMAGSMLGSILFAPKAPDGPRISDLSIQTSTYGQPIPRIFGTARIAGNVIWATDLVEHAGGGGKKGGTSYSYTVSFAVALCEGPIVGVRRIWADGKLIYDIRPTNTGDQQAFTALAMVVYPGDEVQGVDPTIAAHQGDTPAYRGLAYVVFTELELTKYGNRIPNLTFEVVTAGSMVQEVDIEQYGERYTTTGDFVFSADMDSNGSLWLNTLTGHADPADGEFNFSAPGQAQVHVYDPVARQLKRIIGIPLETVEVQYGSHSCYPIGGHGICYGDAFYVGRGAPGVTRLPSIPCEPPSNDYCGNPNPYAHGYYFKEPGTAEPIRDSASSGQFENAFYWPSVPVRYAEAHVAMCGGNGLSGGFGVGFRFPTVGFGATPQQDRPNNPCVCPDDGKVPNYFDGNYVRLPSWGFRAIATGEHGAWAQGYAAGAGGSFLSTDDTGGDDTGGFILPGSSVKMPAACWDDTRGLIWSFAGDSQNELYAWGTAAGFAFPAVPGTSQGNNVRGVTVDKTTGHLRIIKGGGALHTPSLILFNPDTLTVLEEVTLTGLSLANTTGRLFDMPAQRQVVFANGYGLYWITYGAHMDARPAILADIVTALSLDAGLTTAQIDVTELTDEVLGYVVPRQAPTRAALEPLMMAFFFDAVESEGKIKFVKRGKPPALTIDAADLGAHELGQAAPALLGLTRTDELDLPRSISIRYINPEADYQTSVQSARRQTVLARAELTPEIPVVLPDAHAKAVADIGLYAAWVARTTATWSTTLKYARVEPTDVVTIDGNLIRVTKRSLQRNVLSFEGSFDTGRIITAGAVAGNIYASGQVIVTYGQSRLNLLDVALLDDAHDTTGFYVAAAGLTSPWPGAQLIQSTDGGANYSALINIIDPATQGYAHGTLADFAQNTFDEFNTVTVTLTSGTLESTTELAVLNGANRAILGIELLQFKRATLNIDGTYTLSGLLRGRRGSPTTGHAAGERFVLVSGAILPLTASPAEIGLARLYKGVTLGASYASADAQTFTNHARRLLCLAPVHLGGGRNSAGDVTIHCTRRTRLDGAWRDGVDAGLGEALEQYAFDIGNDPQISVVMRTIPTTTPSIVYTAAQQVADFGGLEAPVYVRVCQINATTGRGDYVLGAI